jgi:hypothetical protein
MESWEFRIHGMQVRVGVLDLSRDGQKWSSI